MTSKVDLLISENMNLAYFIAHKWQTKLGGMFDFDDIASDCILGLVKAGQTYNPSKARFSTYAIAVMKNQILMAIRTSNRRVPTVPISTLFKDCGGNCDVDIWNKLQASLSNNNVENWLNAIDAKEKIESILLHLRPKFKEIMRLHFLGLSQLEISIKVILSQSYVSRIITSVMKSLNEVLKDELIEAI